MEQRLTPRLIQSMAVLQKPVADLEAYVEEALERNAALELAEPEAEEAQDGRAPDRAHDEKDGGFARLERFAREQQLDWQERAPSRPRQADGEFDPKMGAMANTPDWEANLQEHLLKQWSLVEVDEQTRRGGEAIIYKLDPDGYLRVALDNVASEARPPVARQAVEAALPLIQRLDPVGIAARDIKECLLLQLEALPGDNRIERQLIENHLDGVAHNRLPAIAKETGYSIGEINAAIQAMRTSLHLHPGQTVGNRAAPPIRPDVIVDYADLGGLDVRLARGNSPRLRIREDVAELAKAKGNGREERDFARKHVEEATALIDAVNFRRGRLLDVARAIVEKQRAFFDEGPSGLKALKMSDLAEELACDPSTISRTVADKFMQTPRGIIPLRYFFTGGTETETGETVGWDHVKTRVRDIVAAEDSKEPLSDDQIAALLAKEGIDISRRTVAKYRGQLGIGASKQRKAY